MRNRQRDEVVRDILQTAARQGAGISRIMFCACLSHSQAVAYLSQLMEDGLMVNDIERGKRYYRTAPKGIEYLVALNTMYELLPIQIKRGHI